MTEYEAVTPSHEDEEIIGEPLVTARTIDSEHDVSSFILVKYMDDEVVFYKNINTQRETHGREERELWDQDIGSGYYKFADEGDADRIRDVQENGKLEDLLEVKGVGDSGIEALRDNGYENVREVVEESKSNLIEVPKIGRKSAQRIFEEFGDRYDIDYEKENEKEDEEESRVESITTSQTNEKKDQSTSSSSDSPNDTSGSSGDGSDDDDSEGWDTLVESDDDNWSMNKL